MSDLALQFQDYRLTTAEILYHLPDHPSLLQSYIWQGYDQAPAYPRLHRFLDFWHSNLDGRLHSVKVASREIVGSARVTHADASLQLH